MHWHSSGSSFPLVILLLSGFTLRIDGSEVLVTIGSSSSNQKSTTTGYNRLVCPSQVDRDNWAVTGEYANYGDTFRITVSGETVTAQRTDGSAGWGLSLQFFCGRP